MSERIPCGPATFRVTTEDHAQRIASLLEPGRVVERQAFAPRHQADRPLVWLELAGGAA